jgi:hypothetical protein
LPATRKGSRWIHQEPDEQEVKDWFEQQSLHKGMQHGPYMGGVVLIPANEKVKVTRQKQNGDTYVAESERVVFTPYVKVDTRIAYFRDYIRALNGDSEKGEFVGVIEPVEVPRIDDANSAFYNAHLPRGFSAFAIKESEQKVARYIVCTMRVAILERPSEGDERVILEGFGSKQTALLRRFPEDNAIMKAETGAVGRALGMAGILVVGTGVATAEDVQEAIAGAVTPATAVDASEAAALPVDAPEAQDAGPAVPAEAVPAEQVQEAAPEQEDEAMRERATALLKEFEEYPEARKAYVEWWQSRKFGNLSELSGPALKGALTKLERDLDAAKS